MTADAAGRGDPIRPLDVVVSCVVLFVFAVAQPLLDLLGRNAEFFLARSAPPIDIVLLSLLVTVVLPLAIGFAVLGIRKIHEQTGRIVHGAVLAMLGGVLALQLIEWAPFVGLAAGLTVLVVRRVRGSTHLIVHGGMLAVLAAVIALQMIDLTPFTGLTPWIEIGLAVVTGSAVAFAYFRFESFREAGRFAAVAPLVVLGLFLLTTSVSQLIFSSSAIAQAASVPVGAPAPVVMIVFDEFPVASLMDSEGNLQESVYPNFARLARDGAWFRNAITVHQQTEDALPAILSGRVSPDNKNPTAVDYPFTLFTLLADSYDLHVFEAVTDLCPEYACENFTRQVLTPIDRWRTLIDDLRVVAGHLFLPRGMTENLPPIDSSWSNFSGGEGSELDIIARFQEITYVEGRLVPIDRFIDSIEMTAGEPSLYFLHALLPHVPWEYLPSGQVSLSSSVAPGSRSPGWGDDEWLVSQAYQRHLMQVEFVDGIVGEVIERLEQVGLYDESLIVILADHGVAVRPGVAHRRVVNEATIGEIAAIPLFIKRPNDAGGFISDYRAEIVDILPTIADILDIEIPWATDGVSLFAEGRPDRTESRISGTEGTIVFGVDGSEARSVASRKVELFGDDGAFGLAPPGHADLLGRRLEALVIEPTRGVHATIGNLASYRDVDKDAPALPTWIRGEIAASDPLDGNIVIAVAVNGEIATVTRSDVHEDGVTRFGAMIPPDALVDGPNEITLILVVGVGAERTFVHLSE